MVAFLLLLIAIDNKDAPQNLDSDNRNLPSWVQSQFWGIHVMKMHRPIYPDLFPRRGPQHFGYRIPTLKNVYESSKATRT